VSAWDLVAEAGKNVTYLRDCKVYTMTFTELGQDVYTKRTRWKRRTSVTESGQDVGR
jgi:hypothetical protein